MLDEDETHLLQKWIKEEEDAVKKKESLKVKKIKVNSKTKKVK